MQVALFGSINPDNVERSEHHIVAIADTFVRHNVAVSLYRPFFELLTPQTQRLLAYAPLFEGEPSHAQMAVSVGGDGTFLRTASIVGRSGIPVLGINSGRLGFLANVNLDDVEQTVQEIASRQVDIEQRTLITCCASEPQALPQNLYALNEIAVLKQDTASMLTIHAYINGDYLTSYQADGLVVATPTGSTAYSLSAGGSILSPTTPSLILSAVAPHNLTSRPLVVDDNSVITLRTDSRSGAYLVSVDGHSVPLDDSISITISKADFTLPIVKRRGHTFFDTLRDKLMWGADVRQ